MWLKKNRVNSLPTPEGLLEAKSRQDQEAKER